MDIKTENNIAYISGNSNLSACEACCTDLRGGAGMVIAGLIAEGETEISDIKHIDRGYEKMEEKFKMLGADIRRIVTED